MLRNLATFLAKGEAFAEERNIGKDVVVNWRLAPDMYSLTRQVRSPQTSPRELRRASPAPTFPNMPTTRRASPS